MIKAIIFDMDGLLIDSEPLWYRARQKVLGSIGFDWTWEHQKDNMGVSTQHWLEYMHRAINKQMTKDEILNGVIESMKQFYEEGDLNLMPGATEALEFAKKNFNVGLASGSYKDLLYTAVRVNKWSEVFQEILSSDDMERGKPHPDIYLEIMKRLNVLPVESIILEDSRDGIRAGVSAGANVIAVPNKEIPVPQDVLDSATMVVDSLHDFPNVTKQLQNE